MLALLVCVCLFDGVFTRRCYCCYCFDGVVVVVVIVLLHGVVVVRCWCRCCLWCRRPCSCFCVCVVKVIVSRVCVVEL